MTVTATGRPADVMFDRQRSIVIQALRRQLEQITDTRDAARSDVYREFADRCEAAWREFPDPDSETNRLVTERLLQRAGRRLVEVDAVYATEVAAVRRRLRGQGVTSV